MCRALSLSVSGDYARHIRAESRQADPIAPNRLGWNFVASRPGQVWLADLTDISDRRGLALPCRRARPAHRQDCQLVKARALIHRDRRRTTDPSPDSRTGRRSACPLRSKPISVAALIPEVDARHRDQRGRPVAAAMGRAVEAVGPRLPKAVILPAKSPSPQASGALVVFPISLTDDARV